MSFSQLGLVEPIVRAVASEGYSTPTPIQLQAIPYLVAGRDLLGCAQTGTGKTAAFALPVLHRLVNSTLSHERRRGRIQALVLAPTRELAQQIADSFRAYGRHTGLRHTVVFGGVKQERQTRELRRGVQILVATPGRLLDLIEQGYIDLSAVEVFVLDEADPVPLSGWRTRYCAIPLAWRSNRSRRRPSSSTSRSASCLRRRSRNCSPSFLRLKISSGRLFSPEPSTGPTAL
jgi:superfamily II DNA/RNA helicase